jgi:acyl-CoA dehydrogenase
MSFVLSEEHKALLEGIESLCGNYTDDYWLERDRDGQFPHDFHRDLAQAGWLGIAMPEEYGGSGLGMSEAAPRPST